jgi:hypothetical protein
MADDTLRVTLRLKTIDHLFEDPDLSPFDPYYAPYSFAAGLDYLAAEMQRARHLKRTELTVLLPPEQLVAEPHLESRTRDAIARYAETWTHATEQTKAVELRTARVVGGSALLFFIVANLLYLQWSHTEELFGESGLILGVLMEGISVGAWVALWWPLDLLYQHWQRGLEERAYRSLKNIELRILPDPAPPLSR